MCFDLSISQNVSDCTVLVDRMFEKDLLPVKVAVFSYFFAKRNGISDPEILADIIMASLFKDFGHAMLARELLVDEKYMGEDSDYAKHPMMSIFLLSKVGGEFTKNLKRYILEHHEQADGSGFPREKRELQISMVSFIINLSEQIFHYSYSNRESNSNQNTTEKFKEALKRIRSKTKTEGLNISFPDSLIESLSGIIKHSDEEV